MPKFKFRHLCYLRDWAFEWCWIRYLCNPGKRGIQIILFGYVFDLTWRRDVFMEMEAGPRWVQSGDDYA